MKVESKALRMDKQQRLDHGNPHRVQRRQRQAARLAEAKTFGGRRRG